MKRTHFLLICSMFYSVALLTGCSNNMEITSPPLHNDNHEALMKIVKKTLSPTDTIIVLPLSHKTVIVHKNLNTQKITTLDQYLNTHTPPNSAPIQPMESMCIYHTITSVEMQNQYLPLSGKTLGIWLSEDVCPFYNAYHTYGFTKTWVHDNIWIDMAHDGGFSYDNLMFSTGDTSDVIARIDSTNTAGRHVGSYFIDEPFENNPHWCNSTLITNIANHVSPSKLFLSSYKMPDAWFNWPVTTYGDLYGDLRNNVSNVYIMCDEYHGDINGDVWYYWNRFKNSYTNKNISNWVSVSANNGDGNTHNIYTGCVSNSWSYLFDYLAVSGGVNEVWLYAYLTGSETGVDAFCAVAWQKGWLLRLGKEFDALYQCTYSYPQTPCEACDWVNGIGDWTRVSAWYTGNQAWYLCTENNPN